MSEAVKRYCMRAAGSIVQPIEVPYGGTWVPSADHDRIVAGLQAQVEQLTAERDQLKEFASASGFVGLVFERDTLRAEVERLKEHEPRFEDVERLVKTLSFLGVSTPESMETACIRWLSLVRTLIRTAEDSKMLRQDGERLAEVEALRKDAELFRRLRNLPDELLGAPGVLCVAIPEGPRAGRYISGPDLDAAMEASR